MTKEFIPYEQALQLQELEFNEPCLGFYFIDYEDEIIIATKEVHYEDLTSDAIPAPLFQQAFRFFRDKHNYQHEIAKRVDGLYDAYVNGDELGYQWSFDTYEEAELACLKKLIEIAKQKQ